MDTCSQRLSASPFRFVLGLNNASFAADDQEDYYLWIFADKLEQATFDIPTEQCDRRGPTP